MGLHARAPEEVRIFYTQARGSHIFTSPDLPNLLIGHPNLHKAFNMVPSMVSRLVARVFNRQETYRPDVSFRVFSLAVKDVAPREDDPLRPVITMKAVHNSTDMQSSV